MKRNRRGQVTVEVAVLFTFVIAALVYMGFYLQRSAQGAVRGNSDSLGQQFSTASGFNTMQTQHSVVAGPVTTTGSCGENSYGLGGTAPAGVAANCTPP